MSKIKNLLLRKLINRGIAIIVVCCFSACQQRASHTSDDSAKEINIINKDNPIQVDLMDIVDSVKYTKLETSEQCLISDINSIKRDGDMYFIHDSKRLLAFDHLGNFKNEIGRLGTAPGEYSYIDCFYIDRNKKNICIACHAQKRILLYSYDGTYLSSLKIEDKDISFRYAMAYGNDMILVNYPVPNTLFQNKKEYTIFKIKGNDLVATPLLESKEITSGNASCVFSYNPIAQFDNKVLFLSAFSNKLYSYENEEASPIYSINLSEACPDPSFLGKHKELEFIELREQMRQQNIGIGITALGQSSDYLFASINNNSTLIWDGDKAVLLSGFHDQDLNLYSDLCLSGGSSDEHVGFYSADFLCGGVKDVIAKSENESLKKIVSSTSEEDNPVIYQYVFKKDMIKSLVKKYKLFDINN